MYFRIFSNIVNKTVIATIIMILFNMNCFILQYTPRCLEIVQGNYLAKHDFKKIHIGMTKCEISSNIGTPTLQDLFESNVWYYIFYHCKNNKIIKYQITILKFDINDILTTINKNNIY